MIYSISIVEATARSLTVDFGFTEKASSYRVKSSMTPYFRPSGDFWSHFTLFWSFLCDQHSRSFSYSSESRYAEVVVGKRTQSCHHIGDVIGR